MALRILIQPLVVVIVGAVAGGLLGTATVASIRPDAVVTERLAGAYGVPRVDRTLDDAYAVSTVGQPYGGYAQADCTDCADYDLGYRWAQDQGFHATARCAIDSWSFQQGCEAAVRAALPAI